MAKCCNEFQEALKAEIIRKSFYFGQPYYLCRVRLCDDGDGHIDEVEDDTMDIKFCPFCGLSLA